MNLLTKIKLSLVGALLALASFLVGNGNIPVLSGVTQGQEYFATTTNTQALFNNYTVIQGNSQTVAGGRPTALGSIVITQVGTSPMCFYDATSTVPNGEWATTTIACFPASAPAGTYTFDAQYKKGILVEFTGSPTTATRASTTITFR